MHEFPFSGMAGGKLISRRILQANAGRVRFVDWCTFGRTPEDVAEKLLKLVKFGIHPQRFSATFGRPDTAKPALGGLLWCFKLVEPGGFEPPSASTPLSVLHA